MTDSPPAAPEPAKRVFVLYHARTLAELEDASVLFATDDLAEARAKQKLLGPHVMIYAYRLVNGMALDGRRLPEEG